MSLENDIGKIIEGVKNQFKEYNDLSPKDQIKKHIDKVSEYMDDIAVQISERGEQHDASKLTSPEIQKWEEYIPKLANKKYGTAEYKKASKEMRDVIDIHHSVNRHHPEYFGKEGLSGMDLVDLLEMLCDWKAASLRTNGGSITKSIDDNQSKLKYDDTLKSILLNTLKLLEDEK